MLVADLHERIRQHVLAAINTGLFSQSALAKRVGVKQAHISNFLCGRRGLSIECMDTILNVLGIDVIHLIAMSENGSGQQKGSIPMEFVPLIQIRAAVRPSFSEEEILDKLGFLKALLRRLEPDQADGRAEWVRFIAVRADAKLAAPMYPRIANGSVLLVDRHYCSLNNYRKDEPNIYLIRKGETMMVRWIEVQGKQLCLRPESNSYSLDMVYLDRKNPLGKL